MPDFTPAVGKRTGVLCAEDVLPPYGGIQTVHGT
jgi:hypothetical protein